MAPSSVHSNNQMSFISTMAYFMIFATPHLDVPSKFCQCPWSLHNKSSYFPFICTCHRCIHSPNGTVTLQVLHVLFNTASPFTFGDGNQSIKSMIISPNNWTLSIVEAGNIVKAHWYSNPASRSFHVLVFGRSGRISIKAMCRERVVDWATVLSLQARENYGSLSILCQHACTRNWPCRVAEDVILLAWRQIRHDPRTLWGTLCRYVTWREHQPARFPSWWIDFLGPSSKAYSLLNSLIFCTCITTQLNSGLHARNWWRAGLYCSSCLLTWLPQGRWAAKGWCARLMTLPHPPPHTHLPLQ